MFQSREASVSSCCWAVLLSLAWLRPVIKIKANFMCSHVIFIVLLKWEMLVVMVSMNFSWISHNFDCLCSWIRSYLPPKKYWWQYIATCTVYPLALLPLFQRAGMRKRGLPLPPALQFSILMIWRACNLNFVMISSFFTGFKMPRI